MASGQSRIRTAAVMIGLVMLIVIVLWTSGVGWSQTRATSQAESLAAWEKIATVLQHPRCLNCHQLNSPLQGDAPRPHVPRVVRGPDNHGVSAMRCVNCHNEMGNNPTARTPGAPHWALAPASMLWQGLSTGELCRRLKNPALNGQRSAEALIHHMETDKLVPSGAGTPAKSRSHRRCGRRSELPERWWSVANARNKGRRLQIRDQTYLVTSAEAMTSDTSEALSVVTLRPRRSKSPIGKPS